MTEGKRERLLKKLKSLKSRAGKRKAKILYNDYKSRREVEKTGRDYIIANDPIINLLYGAMDRICIKLNL